MKKHLFNLIIILLLLIIAIACSKKEEDIVGRWWLVPMSKADLQNTVYWNFDADGTLRRIFNDTMIDYSTYTFENKRFKKPVVTVTNLSPHFKPLDFDGPFRIITLNKKYLIMYQDSTITGVRTNSRREFVRK